MAVASQCQSWPCWSFSPPTSNLEPVPSDSLALSVWTGSKKAQFTWWRLLGLDEMDKMLSITHSNRFTNAEMSSFAIGWAKMLWVCLLRQKCKTFLSESLLSCCLFFFCCYYCCFFVIIIFSYLTLHYMNTKAFRTTPISFFPFSF